MKLTIFTPTFNRAHLLPRLYKSLCEQICKDFVWLVLDDGSTDDTARIVENWKSEGIINIQSFRQENQGKHVAHNLGVKKCETDWFVCVDSDDYMLDKNAIGLIVSTLETIHREDLSGVIFPKQVINHPCYNLPDSGTIMSLRDLYDSGFNGETTLVYQTSILKRFLFPKFEGEKFVTEVVIYDQIDDYYKMLFNNKPVVICEYQSDGLSNNFTSLFRNNPQGWAFRFNQRSKYCKNSKERFVCCAKYACFCMIGKKYSWILRGEHPFSTLLMIPLAIYYKQTRYKP